MVGGQTYSGEEASAHLASAHQEAFCFLAGKVLVLGQRGSQTADPAPVAGYQVHGASLEPAAVLGHAVATVEVQ